MEHCLEKKARKQPETCNKENGKPICWRLGQMVDSAANGKNIKVSFISLKKLQVIYNPVTEND